MTSVLVVDDAADIRWLVRTVLSGAGYEVSEAVDGHKALAALDAAPDLIVLDRMMPGISGLEVLAEIRRRGNTPVILLTAMGAESERIIGLDHGADDYLVKPFSVGELEARVRALLRRSGPTAKPALSIDRSAREVHMHGEAVALTRREFDLLAYLADRPRIVVGVDELLVEVWQSSPEWQDPATVKEHVRRLRGKIDQSVIRTVRGAGFLFDPDAVSHQSTDAETANA